MGGSDFLPQTIWTRNFIESQGYTIDESEFFQDNMSAMHMERNGRSSAGQRSRHINIRYFFIKDRIANGEINLLHCPTGIMVADFFTKPLQGQLFNKFRDVIMGITHFSTLTVPSSVDTRSVLDKAISETKVPTDVARLTRDSQVVSSPVTKTYSDAVKTQAAPIDKQSMNAHKLN